MTTTHADLARVQAVCPTLGARGFDSPEGLRSDADFLAQVDVARRWAESPRHIHLIARRGSYALKHLAEQAARRYVANGAMVAGAVLAGFRPIRTTGPNCRFEKAINGRQQ